MVGYLHRFFPRKTNVLICLKAISNALDEIEKDPSNPSYFGMIVMISNQVLPFIKYYLARYSMRTYVEKRRLLEMLIEDFNRLKSSADAQNHGDCKSIFKEIESKFAKISASGQVYLFRHPDKPGAAELTLNPMLVISAVGSRQRRLIANMIADECLLIPKPIKIEMYTSDQKRTIFVATGISHLANFVSKKYHKNIKISIEGYKPFCYSHFSKEFTQIMIKVIGEGMPMQKFFKKWKSGEFDQYNAPKYEDIKEGFKRFLFEHLADVRHTGEVYKIYVGVSHSLIIDPLLIDYVPLLRKEIRVAEFMKAEFNHGYYRGKWFNL